MLTFHGHATAAVADKFHGGQLAFAHVGLVRFRFTAERAVLAIAAGIAKVARVFGQGAASFTGIGHLQSPFSGGFLDFSSRGQRQRTAGLSLTE